MKSLQAIYEKYRLPENGISDKGTTHSYIEEYEKLFAPFRLRQPISLLEIGLMRGGSLRMWHEYFDRSHVHGIDVSDSPSDVPDLRRLMDERLPRMSISIMDARKPIEVQAMLGNASFDIIIEDASHDLADSLAIYANFIPRLNPGGLYIIEDVADIDASLPVLELISRPRQFKVMDFRANKGCKDDVLVTIS